MTQPNTQQHNMYRKEALEKVASPEQLDSLVRVASPKRWFSLFALGSLVAAGCAWSVFGRIPIIVTGRGVLIYPSKVVTVQASKPGRILALNMQVGDLVKKGQVLATIDSRELRKQLELEREKLAQLRLQDSSATRAQMQRYALETDAIEQQRQTLQQSLQTRQSLTPVLREKGLEVLKRERQNLQQRLETLRQLQPTLKQRWNERQNLFEQGVVPKDMALQARQEYINATAQIDEVRSQLNQLEFKQSEALSQYLENVNQSNKLSAQLKELNSRQAMQKEQDLSAATNRTKEIQASDRNIAQLELQLLNSSQVVSDYNGRVLEITAKPGQQLEPGVGIGTIAAQESSAKLVNVAFLPVSDGKKIQLGSQVQITPSTVKREEFGGIEAKVTSISAFPVTQQGAASLIGNPDILPGVMTQGPQLAVFSELQPNSKTFSGYQWSSSQGPQLKMTPGTTTSVRITVEEKKPIEFVLPILKSWTGLG